MQSFYEKLKKSREIAAVVAEYQEALVRRFLEITKDREQEDSRSVGEVLVPDGYEEMGQVAMKNIFQAILSGKITLEVLRQAAQATDLEDRGIAPYLKPSPIDFMRLYRPQSLPTL